MTLRIGFIGCVKSSREFLNVLLEMPQVEVCAVVTKSESSINNDFSNLSDICKTLSIPYHIETSKQKDESRIFLEKYNLDLIYCFGWSYLLTEDILSLPKICVVGFHPAKLPKNRGRHPIIWALALGLKETASTFFKMDLGADTGEIINQQDIVIDADDNAQDLYNKIINCGKEQVKELTLQFFNDEIDLKSQDHTQASSWRKRTREDGLIDWRMSANSIFNLVRALSPPYPCAEFKIGHKFVKVPKCSVELGKYPLNIEPGYILKRFPSSLLVKVSGTDAVLLENLEIDFEIEGDYL